jgi:hypothetical protein
MDKDQKTPILTIEVYFNTFLCITDFISQKLFFFQPLSDIYHTVKVVVL